MPDIIAKGIGIEPITFLILVLLGLIVVGVITMCIIQARGNNGGVNGDSRSPRAHQPSNSPNIPNPNPIANRIFHRNSNPLRHPTADAYIYHNRSPRLDADGNKIETTDDAQFPIPMYDKDGEYIGYGNPRMLGFPLKDADGNLVYDDYGNIVYDSIYHTKDGTSADYSNPPFPNSFYHNDNPLKNKKDYNTELNEAITKFNAQKLVSKDKRYYNEELNEAIKKLKIMNETVDPSVAIVINNILSCIIETADDAVNRYIDKILKVDVDTVNAKKLVGPKHDWSVCRHTADGPEIDKHKYEGKEDISTHPFVINEAAVISKVSEQPLTDTTINAHDLDVEGCTIHIGRSFHETLGKSINRPSIEKIIHSFLTLPNGKEIVIYFDEKYIVPIRVTYDENNK
jgi:hypothetical protein